MNAFTSCQKISFMIAALFCILATVMGYIRIGLPPMIIIGGAGIVGLICWSVTYLKTPADPKLILPLFILTVACLQVHIIEEYLSGFAPAMSRLFNIPWTEKGFIMVFALIGPTIYTLTSLGLYYRVPIAGFIAWFIFIGPGVAEFTHFIFPLLKPSIGPSNLEPVSETIKGIAVHGMRNYYIKATGHYYFAGMYTAILPMIPGIYAIYRLMKEHRKMNRHRVENK